jgi:hypothetical protein
MVFNDVYQLASSIKLTGASCSAGVVALLTIMSGVIHNKRVGVKLRDRYYLCMVTSTPGEQHNQTDGVILYPPSLFGIMNNGGRLGYHIHIDLAASSTSYAYLNCHWA